MKKLIIIVALICAGILQAKDNLLSVVQDKSKPMGKRIEAVKKLVKSKRVSKQSIISLLADLLLKEKDVKLRMQLIEGINKLGLDKEGRALSALVLASGINNDKVKPLTAKQAGQKQNYPLEWDFEKIWEFKPGGVAPSLRKDPVSPEKIAKGGSGTKEDPYLIATAKQLDNIRNIMDSTKHFRQVADIDLKGYGHPKYGWTPINRKGKSIGSYDGAGYKITNLYINNPRAHNRGLFETVPWDSNEKPGHLTRITLENVNITGLTSVGGLSGNLGTPRSKTAQKTIIDNCFISGKVKGQSMLGGMAGSIYGCKIKNSYIDVKISAPKEFGPLANRIWWSAAAKHCLYNANAFGSNNIECLALKALAKHQPNLDVYPFVFKLIRSDDVHIRTLATKTAMLTKCDKKIWIAGLLNALKDNRYDVRRRAVEVLDKYGKEAKDFVAQMDKEYSKTNSKKEQLLLARAASELSTMASANLLTKMLANPNASVRLQAIEGLRWMGADTPSRHNRITPKSLWWIMNNKDKAVKALQKVASSDSDPKCKELAQKALARITGKNLPPGKEDGDIFLGDKMTWSKVSDQDNKILLDTYAKSDANRLKIIQSFAKSVAWPYHPSSEVRYATAQMYLDQNLEAANKRLKRLIDLPSYGSEAGGLGAAIYPMVYGIFYSKSKIFPGRLSKENEALFKERMFTFINWISKKYFDFHGMIDNVWFNKGTENHHLCFGPPLWYMYLEYLSEDPEYAKRKIYKDKTVAQWQVAWRDYTRKFLKERALKGMWMEIGSGYQKYSYTAYYSLLLSKDKIVRQRAKMFLDLSFIEQAQISYRNVRGGGSSRATPEGENTNVLEALYGQKILNPHTGLYKAMICAYHPPPEAVLLRKKYQYPEKPIFIINTRPGELIGKGENTHKPDTSLVNYCYKTCNFSIGGTLQPVNTRVSPVVNQKRWNGLLFADGDGVYPAFGGGGRIGIPYYHIQNKATIILQRRKEPRPSKMLSEIHVKFNTKRVKKGNWLFVNNGKAYCAVRVAQGDFKLQEKVINKRTNQKILDLIPNDSYTPMIIQGGDVDAYGSFNKFMATILAKPFKWDGKKLSYNGIEFFNINSNPRKNSKINGKEFKFKLSKKYSSPFMNSVGKSKIVITVGDLVTTYDFDKNTIERKSK